MIPLPRCAFWMIRTNHDEADGSSDETIVSAFVCSAEETEGADGPLTIITADHVKIFIPGTLWDIAQLEHQAVN